MVTSLDIFAHLTDYIEILGFADELFGFWRSSRAASPAPYGGMRLATGAGH